MKVEQRNLESEFVFKSSRSGGKGGQNVNKVETKIELNFDINNSLLLNVEEKNKIITKLKNRIDKNGILKIISQADRSQYLNKLKAIKKFYDLIEIALKEEKIRKRTKPSIITKEKRILEKKKISEKKETRKKQFNLE